MNKFFHAMEELGVKADIRKIRRQLKSGYNVVTVADKFSPHTADLIIVETHPEHRRGTLQGVRTYFQSPESLILAKLRMIRATMPIERSQKDKDDITAILANTRVSKRRILNKASREGTIEILRKILAARQGELRMLPDRQRRTALSRKRSRPRPKG
jgi:hypothetical protein